VKWSHLLKAPFKVAKGELASVGPFPLLADVFLAQSPEHLEFVPPGL